MNKLGIRTVRDLIGYFPRAYEDRTAAKNIEDLTLGETVCIRAMAAESPKLSHIRSGLDLVKFRAVDETGSIDITYFNQSYIKDAIKQGEEYIFYGKVDGTLLQHTMANPLYELASTAGAATGRIVPVYSLTAGLSQKSMMNTVRNALDKYGDALPDYLPESVIEQNNLCSARNAYENIHFPLDSICLGMARQRLVFEELFTIAAAMKLMRSNRASKAGRILDIPDFNEFYDTLEFNLTNAQKRAIDDAARDMSSGRPMNRLIQGDVGSGKTLIAAACCWDAWYGGCQSAFMAPTEILAKQHYNSLSDLLEPLDMHVGLLTGSMTPKQKQDVYQKLSSGEIDLIIGTHALLSEGVRFSNLALVITDEQHRFGVQQRATLTEKGDSPHVLVMSATPIPRTLALIIYGDLDVSVIDEMPPGRKPVETFIVDERYRRRINDFIEKLVGEGRQVFIICPMVEEGETSPDDLKSAEEYYDSLANYVFPNLRVALVHGKMPTKEKDAAMALFSSGQADILVATTVVEIGVDVPNAALMIVENADRFGLSQLHQLRGRVGRGRHASYCVLFSGAAGETSRERLEIMRKTNDGFIIAEEDLKIRGPGDFFGSRQHGLPELRIANLASDMAVLRQAQDAADRVLAADPLLSSDENRNLMDQIAHLFEINAEKLN